MDPSIHPLPSLLIDRLRSQTIIPTLSQAVAELVQNSLDAGARHICIHLDLSRWFVRVEDDGVGIPKQGIEWLHAGKRYGTSKSDGRLLGLFGYRGEALSSLARVGCLEVGSRALGSNDTWTCIIKVRSPFGLLNRFRAYLLKVSPFGLPFTGQSADPSWFIP